MFYGWKTALNTKVQIYNLVNLDKNKIKKNRKAWSWNKNKIKTNNYVIFVGMRWWLYEYQPI